MAHQKQQDGGGDGGGEGLLPYYGEDQEPAPVSSRLCIKNIPKHLKTDRLREHFAARGEVTDVKILQTNDGKSRCMAFVGFKTDADATKALEYFNNTFVDTSRIAVEYARAVKSSTLAPRPWSRHSEGSSANARATAGPGESKEAKAAAAAAAAEEAERFVGVREQKKMKKAKARGMEQEMDDMIAADPKLAEFMGLMMPRNKQKIWDNQNRAAFGDGGDLMDGGDRDYNNNGGGGGGGDDGQAGIAEDVQFDDDGAGGSDDEEYQDILDNSGSDDDDEDGSGKAKKTAKAKAKAGAKGKKADAKDAKAGVKGAKAGAK
eukprot:CAMPEP_0197616924 /NCGR_PEP_ID=MMETSP1326-20131121/60776_1 /TAXON_ID=1155430 /ORGANISM="Genus nov. species nov., Strain RCC2288" /LENGTH=318 /DNA_ID=CAMNT_0043185813 /DNA_START=23 /DNA_END=976 /DNA_ORIENTATION=+